MAVKFLKKPEGKPQAKKVIDPDTGTFKVALVSSKAKKAKKPKKKAAPKKKQTSPLWQEGNFGGPGDTVSVSVPLDDVSLQIDAEIKKLKGHDTKAKVTLTTADGATVEKTIDVPVPHKEPQPAPACSIGFQAGQTFNLGNYNSAKVSIILTMPCQAAEIEDTYSFIKEWVNAKMVELQKEVSGEDPQQPKETMEKPYTKKISPGDTVTVTLPTTTKTSGNLILTSAMMEKLEETGFLTKTGTHD